MASSFDDIVNDIGKATVFGRGNYIKQGKGIAVLDKITLDRKTKGWMLIAEFVVESSQSFPDAEPTDTSGGQPEQANSPGSSFSVICGPLDSSDEQERKMQLGKARELLEGLGGPFKEGEDLGTTMKAATSPQEPLKGLALGFTTSRVTTKTTKKRITVPTWRFIEGQTAEVRAARRAALSAASPA